MFPLKNRHLLKFAMNFQFGLNDRLALLEHPHFVLTNLSRTDFAICFKSLTFGLSIHPSLTSVSTMANHLVI